VTETVRARPALRSADASGSGGSLTPAQAYDDRPAVARRSATALRFAARDDPEPGPSAAPAPPRAGAAAAASALGAAGGLALNLSSCLCRRAPWALAGCDQRARRGRGAQGRRPTAGRQTCRRRRRRRAPRPRTRRRWRRRRGRTQPLRSPRRPGSCARRARCGWSAACCPTRAPAPSPARCVVICVRTVRTVAWNARALVQCSGMVFLLCAAILAARRG